MDDGKFWPYQLQPMKQSQKWLPCTSLGWTTLSNSRRFLGQMSLVWLAMSYEQPHVIRNTCKIHKSLMDRWSSKIKIVKRWICNICHTSRICTYNLCHYRAGEFQGLRFLVNPTNFIYKKSRFEQFTITFQQPPSLAFPVLAHHRPCWVLVRPITNALR